jgi:UPF0755 protein
MHFDIMPIGEDGLAHSRLRVPRRIMLIAGALVAAVLGAVALWLISPPRVFPANSIITIAAGSSAADFATELAQEDVIRSPLIFRALARISGLDHHLDSGIYAFTKPVTLVTVLWRVSHDEHGIEEVRITFTEGMTRFDMADTLANQLPGFSKEEFLDVSSTSEGYLFPETYQFMPGTPAGDIVTRLKSQFSMSIATITPQILASKHPFNDAVIMASILEREANTAEDRRIVAGILWNRIAKRMPLQVDAAFGYIHRQNGYTPTASDLAMDSPYNTYKNQGLPPTPISNPGLDSLLAAVEPAKTSYLYYLTGTDGKMHYATTFEGHKKNRELYLK